MNVLRAIMNFNRWFVTLLLLVVTVCIFGDEAEKLRKQLPSVQGKERFGILQKLYDLSLETDDLDYQLKCINDWINEARHQGDHSEEGNARVLKMTLFYNTDLNDSLFQQAPDALEFLGRNSEWKNYYETWSLLINGYNFAGLTNTGLKEAKEMYDDAKGRNDDYGMGMAYYSMGNVYANMNNIEEAASSYQRSLDLFANIDSMPMQVSDIYAYYGDVLEIQKEYQKLDALTEKWKTFLTDYYADKKEDTGEAANRWAYYYLACAQAAIGEADYQKASAMLDEVQKRTFSKESFLYMRWLYYRAELCRLQGFYDEALALNDRRMRMMDDTSDKTEIFRVRQQRAQIFEAIGRYQEAALLYHEMYLINDSINTHDTKRQLTEMNTLLHVDELKAKQAQEQARLEMEKAQQQRLGIIIISSIIVLSLAIFLFFRIRSAKRLKIAHEKLEDAHSKLETTHQELLTAYDQLEETTIAKERIESDLRIARDIQMSMVPSTFPDRPDLDLYASMTPAKEVGGDLYGYVLMDDKLYFALGDVSGKGVPASLFMAQATRLFRTLAAQGMMPAEIATRINDALSGEDNERGMFVTMFLGLLDLTSGHLDFCNAGHNPPVLIGDGTTEFIEMIPNAPIGLWPELEYEGEEITDITNRPLFVYTDGLNEAENNEKEQFSDEKLLEILQTTPFESCEKTIEMLREEVEKHREGAEPNDDLTMLCVKFIKENQ